MKGAVIGRPRIDPLVLKIAKSNHMKMVDLSAIPSFHQGMTDARNKEHMLKPDDYYYNLRFIRYSEEGRLLANYRVYDYYIE